MVKDLTVGKPGSVMLKYCLPLFASVIFQQLYNLADSVVAGQFLGEEALAAVGNGFETTQIFIAFALGCNIGCSVIISNYFGAKRIRDMRTAVNTSLIINGVLCAAMMIIGLVFAVPIMRLINTPENIIEASAAYLRIYIWNLPFVFFYNAATGVFSALGDSRTPFLFLSISSLANIGMDVLFVTKFRSAFGYGVEGVAWATFICQGVSAVLAVIFMFRRISTISTEEKPALFSRSVCKEITKIAIPSILQQVLLAVGNVFVESVVNTFGSSVVAGFSAVFKLSGFIILPIVTFGNGVSYFTSQNLGAGKPERIKQGCRSGILIAIALSLPIMCLFFFCWEPILRIFLNNSSAEAMETGRIYIRAVSPCYFILACTIAISGVLRGIKKMRAFLISTFSDLIVRTICCYVLASPLGILGISISWPIGWIAGLAVALIAFLRINWKTLGIKPTKAA